MPDEIPTPAKTAFRTPKDKFAGSDKAAEFSRILSTAAFEDATLAALLQLEYELPTDCDAEQSLNAHQQMAGARKYLDILWQINQKTAVHEPRRQRGLDYSKGI